MDNLNFKEKMALKLLIKNNHLGHQSISVGSEFVNNMCCNVLLCNKHFLEEILLKSIINYNSLESELYKIIENEFTKTNEQFELWEHLKDKIAKEYLSDNLYEAYKIPQNFDVAGLFKEAIKDKIIKAELDENMIDKISKMLVNNLDCYWLPLTISELQQEGKQDLFLYAVDKLRIVLENKVNSQNIPEEDKTIVLKAVNQIINRFVRGGFDYYKLAEMYYNCMFANKYDAVTSIARVGTTELKGITINQIANINVKNVKQIIEVAKEKYKNIQADENQIFCKLYLIFGKQRTIELIEGKYGQLSIDQLRNIVIAANTNNYKIEKPNAEPSYDKAQTALINFFFASGPNDINANMKKILSGEISSEDLPLARLINEWKLYYDFLGGNITVSDLITLMDNVEIVLPPNEKQIANTIKIFGIKHKDKITDTYTKMQKRTVSTIPKVKGIAGEYEYEILDMVDPRQMNVGYDTKCCFIFGGPAENTLIHACTNEDSRIFVIKKDDKVVAQSWVWRNGNVVCFDNVEIAGVSSDKALKFMDAYDLASKQIIDISQEKEPSNKKIQLVTIGTKNSKIELRGKKLECEKLPLPINRNIYTDANEEQVIVATSSDYEKPLEYEVEAIYQDQRKKVMVIDPQQSSRELIKMLDAHIDKINYSIDSKNFKECNSSEDYTLVIYGFDWFIGIMRDGNIVKKEYSFDERSKVEISNALQLINEKIKSGELSNNINDIILDSMIKESETYGK